MSPWVSWLMLSAGVRAVPSSRVSKSFPHPTRARSHIRLISSAKQSCSRQIGTSGVYRASLHSTLNYDNRKQKGTANNPLPPRTDGAFEVEQIENDAEQ